MVSAFFRAAPDETAKGIFFFFISGFFPFPRESQDPPVLRPGGGGWMNLQEVIGHAFPSGFLEFEFHPAGIFPPGSEIGSFQLPTRAPVSSFLPG